MPNPSWVTAITDGAQHRQQPPGLAWLATGTAGCLGERGQRREHAIAPTATGVVVGIADRHVTLN